MMEPSHGTRICLAKSEKGHKLPQKGAGVKLKVAKVE
jgi:hypothetical protein